MKTVKFFVVLFVSFCLISACSEDIKYEGTFSYQPLKPKPSEKILVKYNPTETNLKNSKKIKMFVYQFNDKNKQAIEFEMLKNGIGYTAEFIPEKDTKGIVIKFAERELTDNNNDAGYLIPLNDENGKIIEGYFGGLANMQSSWGRYVGFLKNTNESLKNFNQAFTQYPNEKNIHLENYLNTLFDSKIETNINEIIKELEILENKNELSENEYLILYNFHKKIGNEVKVKKFENLLNEKYKSGEYAEIKAQEKMQLSTDIKEREKLLNDFINQFPESKKINTLYTQQIRFLRNEKAFPELNNFILANKNKIHPYYFYWTASNWENSEFPVLKKLLENGIETAGTRIREFESYIDELETKEEFTNETKYYLGLNQFQLGKLLSENSKPDEALILFENGFVNTFDYGPEQKFNELYIELLLNSKNFDKALKLSEKLISSGNGSSKVMDLLKSAYVSKNGNEEGFAEYSKQFEAASKKILVDKLKKEMINEPAPNFTLKDLDGKEVSLSDYKNQIVIVDFWATWCGPCLKSFPGIKTAVEKMEKEGRAKFLFVNTWERVKDVKKNATDFIEKNNYPFHVLLDDKNEVVAKYKVSGIPTKFIVDKTGNIRFKSVGFGGNVDQIMVEIEEMIAMIN